MLDEALRYRELDLSVIPVSKSKKPLIKWEEYQKRLPTEDEIRSWWTKHPNANIGIVTGSVSGLVVIDIDEAEGHEAIKEYIPDMSNIPTVSTPRGGKHLYFKAPHPCPRNNTRLVPGCDFRGEGGFIIAPPSMGTAEGSRGYVWQKSIYEYALNILPYTYILYINSINTNLISNRIGGVVGGGRGETDFDVGKMFTEGSRDNSLFHIANQLIKSKTNEKVVREVLKRLALFCDPPYPLEDIPEKIESAINRAERKVFNLTEEIRDWISVTDGDFSVTDWLKSGLSASSVTNRDTARKIFQRFKKEGYIEKVGDRDGVYRRVNKDLTEIDYMSAIAEVMPLNWPFEIERWVHTFPKSIQIIAGMPNAGKTAFLLCFCQNNMNDFPITYFSSEMGAVELRNRLGKFDIPISKWNMKFFEKSSNFEDGLDPNGINVIDFLEIYDEFYKIGLHIKQIYDKLDKGIAVIAIQKNPETDFGIGGMRSIEKARLYLALDRNTIKIVKAKNWATETNPNGLAKDFKLIQGAKFISESPWERRN